MDLSITASFLKSTRGRSDLPFIDVSDDLESGFNAIFVNLASLESGNVVFPREAEDVVGVVASQSDKFAVLRPVDLLLFSLCLIVGGTTVNSRS